MTLLASYQNKINSNGFLADPAQEKAVTALESLRAELESYSPGIFGVGASKPLKGIYLYGGVGRGKSMLMDLFFASLPDSVKGRRVHFHVFMLETHDWLHKRRGDKVDTLIPDYAKHVAKQVRVLCFDEFFVTDVADAMILGRLFTALLDLGVVMVLTSNWKPEKLYEGGLQRDRFLPFIDLLKEKLDIIHLDSATDYRMIVRENLATYFYPLGRAATQAADNLFAGLTDCAETSQDIITIKGRDILVPVTAQGVARMTFSTLCEQPRGAEDYLAIASRYHTLFLEGVPKMGYDRRNEAKRLMTLVDVLYDNHIRLIVTADAKPEKLYYGDDHAFEFQRTISRLNEMQSADWQMSCQSISVS